MVARSVGMTCGCRANASISSSSNMNYCRGLSCSHRGRARHCMQGLLAEMQLSKCWTLHARRLRQFALSTVATSCCVMRGVEIAIQPLRRGRRADGLVTFLIPLFRAGGRLSLPQLQLAGLLLILSLAPVSVPSFSPISWSLWMHQCSCVMPLRLSLTPSPALPQPWMALRGQMRTVWLICLVSTCLCHPPRQSTTLRVLLLCRAALSCLALVSVLQRGPSQHSIQTPPQNKPTPNALRRPTRRLPVKTTLLSSADDSKRRRAQDEQKDSDNGDCSLMEETAGDDY